jgi:Zn finger protein HypA/HybF involved in hydrogenase expression
VADGFMLKRSGKMNQNNLKNRIQMENEKMETAKPKFNFLDNVFVIKEERIKMKRHCRICDNTERVKLKGGKFYTCPACDNDRTAVWYNKRITVGIKITAIQIRKYSGGFYFTYMSDGTGWTEEKRIFKTKQEASAYIRSHKK